MKSCLKCGRETKNPKFCSSSCAASFNNVQHPKRVSKKKCVICGIVINNRSKYCDKDKPIRKRINKIEIQYTCNICGKIWFSYSISASKSINFCSNQCANESKYRDFILKWLKGEINGSSAHCKLSLYVKRWLFERAKNSCEKCGFSTVHPRTGNPILEIHHLDENPENSAPGNLIVLCPNCHALTETRNTAKGNGRRYYREQYYRNKE